MKKKLLSLVILLVLLGSIASTALAATLRFQVVREVVNLYLNTNGTASVEYFYDFSNDQGSLIDYVDVGVPTSDYDLGSVTADINSNKITDIAASPYVNPGVAVGLGSHSIESGGTGQLHVLIQNVRGMFYEADISKNNEKYASFNFTPNWFDSQYAHGSTDLTVNLFLPSGVKNDEPTYIPPTGWPGTSAPTTGVASNGLSFYSWRSSSANAYTKYQFGGTFPARLIPASTVQTKPLLNIHISGESILVVGFLGCFALIFGFSIYGATVGARKRKLQYLPPKIAIEGMGIKRGLTAVEAAILMEQPMDKIMTMILFSAVKKGGATVVTKDPLALEVANPLPDTLQTYESDFLKGFTSTEYTVKQGDTWASISSNVGVPAPTIKDFNHLTGDAQPLANAILKIPAAKRKALQDMMVNLVKTVTEKMKGFSRKDTVAYYTDIMKKAWEQVEAAQTPDVKMQAFDNQMDWAMLDDNFDNRTRNVFRTGPVFVPIWWGRFDPVYRGSAGTPMPTAGGQPGGGGINISIPRPNVPGADFAQSVVNGIQGVAGSVVGDVTAFTGSVTNLTNPVPVTPPSTSGRSGSSTGGHCVCACACACAGCACACAGGGR